MKVEILVAREDGMWDTKIEDVPEYILMSPGIDFSAWCSVNLPHEQYGDAILFSIYNDAPEDEGEGR